MNRYKRQYLFPPIQERGQKKLLHSSVLVVGAGALGTVICNHLARAGVGHIRLVDRDYVEWSNLQRQMLFDEDDVKESLPKAIAAKHKLEKINSEITIEAIVTHVTHRNIEELVDGVDVVLDGTDNFSTRFLLNDICFKKEIPFSYGGVVSSRGISAFFIPKRTPCFRCMVTEGSDHGQTCDTVGVIAPVVDVIASLEVTETLKYLTGNTSHLRNTVHTIDLWYNRTFDIKFSESKHDCPTCQQQLYPSLHPQVAEEETVLCGRNTVQIYRKSNMDLAYWEKQLANVATVRRTPFLLRVEFRKGIEFVIFPDGRVLVQGTEDTIQARTWYDRYIGS